MDTIVESTAAARQSTLKRERPKLTIKEYKGKVDPDWCPGCGDFGVLAALKRWPTAASALKGWPTAAAPRGTNGCA